MKKRFTFIYLILLLLAGMKNVQGQTWGDCNSTPQSIMTPPYNGQLVEFKSHYFYFGQVWHGELLVNNTNTTFQSLFNDNSYQYQFSKRHYKDIATFTSQSNSLKTQLNSLSGDVLNIANGTGNNISFWNSRMSAGNAGLGENMLIGFVRSKGSTKECIYVTKKWKDISSATSSGNFNDKNDKILSDRTVIYSNTINKAHIIINTQNTSCTEPQSVIYSPAGPTSPAVDPKGNHFLYTGFPTGTTNVTLQYTNCSGNSGGLSGGPARTIPITNNNANAPSIAFTSQPLDCVNGKRKMKINLTGGTGVYEMHHPGKKTYFPKNEVDPGNDIFRQVVLDEYKLVDPTGVFGTDTLLLDPGIQTIKVRDARLYDELIFARDPAHGDTAMDSLLYKMQNKYHTISVNVQSCGVCNFILSNNSQTGVVGNSLTLNPNCSGSDCSSVAYTWTRSAQNGQSAQSGSGLTVTLPSVPATYTYSVTGIKSGCSSQTVTITVNVTSSCPTLVQADWNTQSDAVCTSNGTTTFKLRINATKLNGQIAQFSTDGTTWYDSNMDNGAGYTFSRSATSSCVSFWARPKCNTSNQIWGCYTGQSSTPCSTCNFTLSNNSQTGVVGNSLTLNPNCSGSDCSSVAYTWTRSAQNGQSAQSGSGLTVTLPSVPATYTYSVTGIKSGCSSQTVNITVTVTNAGTCNLTVTAAYNCSSHVLETVTVTGGSGNYTYNIDGCENSIAKNTMGYTGEAAKYVDYAFWWQQLTAGAHTLYIKDKNNPSYCGSFTWTIFCAPTGSPTTICGSGRLGIEEERSLESPSFSLYPNPAGNTINYQLAMDKDNGKANVYIYSVTGQRVFTKEATFTQKFLKDTIDISQLNSGDYFLQVEENAKLVTKKFVKK